MQGLGALDLELQGSGAEQLFGVWRGWGIQGFGCQGSWIYDLGSGVWDLGITGGVGGYGGLWGVSDFGKNWGPKVWFCKPSSLRPAPPEAEIRRT